MNIIACVKQVPDTEAQIKVKADGSGIEEGQIKWVMNPYDEFGVEEALKLKEKNGGDVTIVCVGPARAMETIRTALAGTVDAVATGAGGHAGTQSAFSLVREIREFWSGMLVLGGSISDGYAVRAAEVLGADLAYMGTRFIATRESIAQEAYKQMLVDAAASDIVYTDAVSGTNANFLWPSLQKAGYRREELVQGVGKGKLKPLTDEAKAWRDMWSAGHGVATIHDVPSARELCDRLAAEYRAACALPPSPAV